MLNYKLIAISLGEDVKWESSINQIGRIGSACFSFEAQDHPHESISSQRAQFVYDWVMTLAEQDVSEEEKKELLRGFVTALAPDSSVLKMLDDKPDQQEASTTVQDDANMATLHPVIRNVSEGRFADGYFADSVEAALKEINSRVKKAVRGSTGAELDGSTLMTTAFSVNKPVIVLDDLDTESGRNIQQGYMMIFTGSMIGIRNPKAHANVTITPERAMQFLHMASLLMSKLDEVGV